MCRHSGRSAAEAGIQCFKFNNFLGSGSRRNDVSMINQRLLKPLPVFVTVTDNTDVVGH